MRLWEKRVLFTAVISGTALLTGCDYTYGVRRSAGVHRLPDLNAVRAEIRRYPEIGAVELQEEKGSRPLTLTGIKQADEVYYLSYRGGENVRGTLMFTRNYKGEVRYDQYLIEINRRPPQAWIDATWPVMKKIERDLETHFGLPEIRGAVSVHVFGVKNPDRNMSDITPVVPGG